MERVSGLTDREVLTTDGNLMGWVKGLSFASVGDWKVTGLSVKLEKETIEEMGKKKPFMGGVIVDIGVENVKSVSDNVLLNQVQRSMRPLLRTHSGSRDVVSFMEKQVVDSKGKDIGMVTDIMVDTEGWALPSLVIKLEKEVLEFLRMEKCPDCERSVMIPMNNVNSVGDMLMLNITKEDMGDLVHKVPVKTM